MFFKKTQPETTAQQKLVQNWLQHSAVKKSESTLQKQSGISSFFEILKQYVKPST